MQFHVSEPTTLLSFLKICFPDSSANQIKKWIEQGRVQKQEKTLSSPIAPLNKGDTLLFLDRIKKEKSPFKVLYEDQYFIVVDKPAGLLSVDTETKEEMSLHSYLKKRFPRKKVWVVHRLDKETSGAILFALDQQAFHSLKEQLKARTMKRRYFVLVEGVVEGSGTWDSFLFEDSSLIMRVVPPHTPHAERAITHWHALGHTPTRSLLECHLHTGKKNQIRVQAAHFGHPLIGDEKYKSSKRASHLGLHAYSLECTHPISLKEMTFIAPFPPSFSSLVPKKLLSLLK